MSVAARFAAGAGLLILLLAAALTYHLSLLDRLVEGQQDFADVHFTAIELGLELGRLTDEVEETARKLSVTQDPDYAIKLLDLGTEYQKRLDRLAGLPLPDRLRDAVSRLQSAWVQTSLVDLWALPSPASDGTLLALLKRIDSLHRELDDVIAAARASMRSEAGRAERRRREAQSISWAVLGLALLLGVIVLALTVRSVRRGMKALTAGTRIVAEGEFSHRIDAGGGELGRLADAFNRMTARLDDLERLKTELLSRVSHELRTPLVAMHETNQLLLEELPGPLTAKQRRLLEINREGGRRLAGMIGKLLDLSSLEAGATRFDLAPHDLTGLTRQAFSSFEGRARERGVELALDALPRGAVIARCDGERVLQVMENLLDNAIKHAPEGSRVRLRLAHRTDPLAALPRRWRRRAQPGAAGIAVLSVLDRGPGVPQDQRQRIFDKFHRLASGRRDGSADGVGLGLAICREIAVAHGGAVWADGRRGGGSEFCFALGVDSVTAATPLAAGVA